MLEALRSALPALAAWFRHGALGYTILRASVFSGGCFLVIAACERRAGASLTRYASRHFAIDLLYRLVFLLYVAAWWDPMVAALSSRVPSLHLALLNRGPLWIALPAYFLIFDFLGYWIHRMQHSRWLWRFHRVHHSQEQMTYATGYRHHPVDQLFALGVPIVPGLLLGTPVFTWLPYTLGLAFLDALYHARLPWRFGWLRHVFVSPVFHAQHHARDAMTHHRNYGGLFACWDHLFGTALDAVRPPERTGVEGWRVRESFWAHLFSPFRRDSVVVTPLVPPPEV